MPDNTDDILIIKCLELARAPKSECWVFRLNIDISPDAGECCLHNIAASKNRYIQCNLRLLPQLDLWWRWYRSEVCSWDWASSVQVRDPAICDVRYWELEWADWECKCGEGRECRTGYIYTQHCLQLMGWDWGSGWGGVQDVLIRPDIQQADNEGGEWEESRGDNNVLIVVKEGVSLLRSRFGFTRTTGTGRFGGTTTHISHHVVSFLSQDLLFTTLPPRRSGDRSCSWRSWNTSTRIHHNRLTISTLIMTPSSGASPEL